MGPDILLFGASIFAKSGKDRAYVSWHQDSAYFGLEPHEEITAWVAFTQSNGRKRRACRCCRGTHLGPDLVHEETYAPDNMLARGQSLKIEDESSAVTIELQPGEFSLHHERTAHGSKQNRTGRSAHRLCVLLYSDACPLHHRPPQRHSGAWRGPLRLLGCRSAAAIRSRSGSLCGVARRLGPISRRRGQAGRRSVSAGFRSCRSPACAKRSRTIGAGRHQPFGVRGRDGLYSRAVRRRQIDIATLHQLAGGAG